MPRCNLHIELISTSRTPSMCLINTDLASLLLMTCRMDSVPVVLALIMMSVSSSFEDTMTMEMADCPDMSLRRLS